ncbi:MAG: Mpo1-like protein [Maricaulaceae bacterium]
MSNRIQTYAEFWPHYLREHARPRTRSLHYVGTALSLAALAAAVLTLNPLWLLGMPLGGYGFAWASHAFVERNKPATFTHPLWSLVSDYRMFFFWLSGRLTPELERAGVAPAAS